MITGSETIFVCCWSDFGNDHIRAIRVFLNGNMPRCCFVDRFATQLFVVMLDSFRHCSLPRGLGGHYAPFAVGMKSSAVRAGNTPVIQFDCNPSQRQSALSLIAWPGLHDGLFRLWEHVILSSQGALPNSPPAVLEMKKKALQERNAAEERMILHQRTCPICNPK